MSDVLKPVIGSNTIKNGSMVVYQTKGQTSISSTYKRDPDLNSFVPSGTLHTRLDTRFDDVRYYSGDTAN
jgi:hypothetical protein